MHAYYYIIKRKNLTVIFLPILTLKLLHYLLSVISSQVNIIIVYIIYASTSQYLSSFHSLFNNEKACAEKETKLDFISSIWDDDHIQMFDENKWQCLWCNKIFQGINATEALARVLKKRVCILKTFTQPWKNPI